MPGRAEVYFPMETTSIGELISWHRQTDDLIRQDRCTNPAFIKPYHLAVLAAKMITTDQTIRMPNGDLEHYAARMHLWQVLGQEPPVLMNEHRETGRFQPLTSIRSDHDVPQIADQIIELFRPICADDMTRDSIYSLAVEILGNCVAHAQVGMESIPYGFVCGQVWRRARRAQIAVIDSGIGIRQTLQRCGQYQDRLATENACALATEYSVTSKAGNGHSGYGLTLARDLMMQNGGALHILSMEEWFSSRGMDGLHEADTIADPGLQGTLIVLEWDTSRPLNSGAVYAQWPNEQEEDDDDFNWDF